MSANSQQAERSTVERLRELAEAATPGPWVYDAAEITAPSKFDVHEGKPWYVVEVFDNGESGVQSKVDGDYIAAVSPDVVLALLNDLDRLRILARVHLQAPSQETAEALTNALARLDEETT